MELSFSESIIFLLLVILKLASVIDFKLLVVNTKWNYFWLCRTHVDYHSSKFNAYYNLLWLQSFDFYFGMSQINVQFMMLALRVGWRSKQRSLTKLGSSDHTLKDVQKFGK